MFRYSAFGMVLDSELEFPELGPASGEPDVSVRLGELPQIEHRATSDEEYVINVYSGTFRVRGGSEVVADLLIGATPEAVRVLMLGRVMAALLRQRGWLPLHASGVAMGGKAVLFLGPSGSGKSTTAAAFHARGHDVLTDDVGAVRVADGVCVVQPGGSRLRLCDDSRLVLSGLDLTPELQFDKHAYELPGQKFRESIPVSRIYVPEAGNRFLTEVLRPALAAALLNRHSFLRPRRSEPEVLKAHLTRCGAVANVTPVCRLVRPYSLSLLPELVRSVEADLYAATDIPAARFPV